MYIDVEGNIALYLQGLKNLYSGISNWRCASWILTGLFVPNFCGNNCFFCLFHACCDCVWMCAWQHVMKKENSSQISMKYFCVCWEMNLYHGLTWSVYRKQKYCSKKIVTEFWKGRLDWSVCIILDIIILKSNCTCVIEYGWFYSRLTTSS